MLMKLIKRLVSRTDPTQRDVRLFDGAAFEYARKGRVHDGVLQVLSRPSGDAVLADATVGRGTDRSDAGAQEEEELMIII